MGDIDDLIDQAIAGLPSEIGRLENELSSLTELLFELHSNLTVWKNISASKSGPSASQMNALEIIGNSYTLKMKELATNLGVTLGSLSVMIDRLEKKGMVRRSQSEDDRRSIMVYLTENGRAAFLMRYKQQLEFIDKSLHKLDSSERKTLHVLLTKILSQIKSSAL